MSRESITAIIGSDRPNPLPVVIYDEPKPKQKGLNWAAISQPPPADAPAPTPTTVKAVRQKQMAVHAERVARVEQLEGRKPKKPAKLPATVAEAQQAPMGENPAPVVLATDGTKDGEVIAIRTDTGAMLTLHEPTPALPSEVQAVAETLRQTTDTTDMVVAACRAAVIAAADALRGAALRAAEGPALGRYADPAKAPRGGSAKAAPRIEEKNPAILEEIQHRYVELGQSVETIGAELGISPNTVGRVMHRNGITVRRGGGAQQPGRERVNRRLAELGVTSRQVRDWAKAVGLTIAERGVLPEHILDRFEASL